MAIHLKIVLLPCLLLLMLLMEDVKPVLAKKGGGLKQRTKILEETVRKLKEQMKEQGEKIKEQEEKMKEQREKMKEQEVKIKAMEECKACSKIKILNETVSELQEKINSKPVCGPVGVEDRNTIPDARMTASTIYNTHYYPYYGRLNGNRGYGAWCTKTKSDRTDYLQVDMGAVHSVCAVETQGEGFSSSWSTSYKVHFSRDGVTWSVYKENNVEKVFPGNTDQHSIVKHSLSTDVKARFVRFYPVTYYSHPCLRVEIFV
ncbi:lactadherin-like isoform X2 [Oculina patagonica]